MTSFHEKVQASTGELFITGGSGKGTWVCLVCVFWWQRQGKEEIPLELCTDTS